MSNHKNEEGTICMNIEYEESFKKALCSGINLFCGAGLPVVASKIRGHTDVIEDCVNGFLFCENDSAGFAKAIILLYKNPSLRTEMGRRNVIEAQKYSVDIALNNMSEIYGSLIN